MAVNNLVKSLQNIMRSDAGVNGDAQRIEQMVWMFFLKVYDAQELDWECEDEDYQSIIPEQYRWRNWAPSRDENGQKVAIALTGDELLRMVNDMFDALKNLPVTEHTKRGQSIVRDVFSEVNRSLRMPFLNIEMQTTGAFIDGPFLDFFKNAVGLTTCAVSVACLDDDRRNREITGTRDEKLSLSVFCREVKNRNINLRLCLNMNDEMLLHHDYSPESIAALCGELGADQITFRALWSPGSDTPQGEWIDQHVTDRTLNCIEMLKEDIRRNGRYLDTLEYGSDRYDYHGFSVVIDEDCMSQENRKDAIKYLILRPNGHLYTKWDSAASLVF